MPISAPGIGSGLDIQGIVSQLVELEKKPLEQLQTTASSLQTQLSAFGQLKSQFANLQTQASALASVANWTKLAFSSSNSAAVTGSVTAAAAATRFSVEVSQLAKAQSTASGVVAANATLGGTLSITLGSWSGIDLDENTVDTPVFAASGSAITVDIENGDDLADVAAKINASGAGVTATILKDASGERLLIRSSATGEEAGFRITTSDLTTGSTLGNLAFDPQNLGSGQTLTELGQNTQATINGVPVTSTNNRFEDAVPGVTLVVAQETSGPVDVNIAQDSNGIKKLITNFVESFNALSNALKEMTKYDAATKTAGTLQGDSTAVGLHNALKRMIGGLGPGDTGTLRRLSDVGVQLQLDGTLKVDDADLNAALAQPEALKTFFTAVGAQGAEGLGVRFRHFAQGLVDSSGTLTARNKSIQSAIDRNTKDQDKLLERIERVETRLLAQYSRLDTQLAGLNALSDYVAQQITTWNNQNDN